MKKCNLESCLFNFEKSCISEDTKITPDNYNCSDYIDNESCSVGDFENCRTCKLRCECIYKGAENNEKK